MDLQGLCGMLSLRGDLQGSESKRIHDNPREGTREGTRIMDDAYNRMLLSHKIVKSQGNPGFFHGRALRSGVFGF